MKKIGILFGQEHSFPPAFVERVNQKTGSKDIMAEFVKIDKVLQGEPCGYDVVIDRISQDVPFYRAWLKNEALTGCAVVNNPFWWSADEKFFNNALATKIGVAVPRTVLLPSYKPPTDTIDKSLRNLGSPRLARDFQLRQLAGILQTVRGRRLEERYRLLTRRILSRLRRGWPAQ
jgi:glutathione synthase/RimK-type ligase-like ATP-grasp enzyme